MRKVCSVEGCGREHEAKGFCDLHYSRITRFGTLNPTFDKGSRCHPRDYANTFNGEVGLKFNSWTTTGSPTRVSTYVWKVPCRCVCGIERLVLLNALIKNKSKSCGCVGKQIAAEFNRNREYEIKNGSGRATRNGLRSGNIWQLMIARCYKKTNHKYPIYGGRGITVCDRWLGNNGYLNFASDMGEPPSKTHSIGRINNDGNYCPENCRWETPVEQAQNTRATIFVEHSGRRLRLHEWSEIVGLKPKIIAERLRRGWSSHEALFTPAKV